MRLLLFLIFIHTTFLLSAQDILKKYSPEELKEDYRELREKLEKHHKGLYLFTPKEELDAFFDSTYQALNREMSEVAFYKVLARTLVKTKEKHTSLGVGARDTLSNIARVVTEKKPILPLVLAFVEEKTYVFANGSPDSTLRQGMEILKINSQSMTEIRQKILPYIVADGNIQVSKYKDLADWFYYYYYWLIDQPENFVLQCKSSEGKITDHKVPALPLDSLNYWLGKYYPEQVKKFRTRKLISLSFKENDKVAILDISTFNYKSLKENGINFYKEIKTIFKTIKKKKSSHLIIDLRGNQGGKIDYFVSLFNKISKVPKKTLLFKYDKPKSSSETLSSKAKAEHFKGKTYILVNGRSFSSAAMLASLARVHAQTTIIGEETAGRFDGTTAGQYKYFNLKNTKIGIRIPLYLYKLNVKEGKVGRGLIPDHIVPLTVEDFDFESDRVLDFTLDLIKKDLP